MTVIEARYVGPYKVEDWGTWFTWGKYDIKFYAEKSLPVLRRQFWGLYEFRIVGL